MLYTEEYTRLLLVHIGYLLGVCPCFPENSTPNTLCDLLTQVLGIFCCCAQQVLATASAVSRANMATSDWLRPFDFDRVFWSIPGQAKKQAGEVSVASEQATQQNIFEGLGERIVEDVLNVSFPWWSMFSGGLMEAAVVFVLLWSFKTCIVCRMSTTRVEIATFFRHALRASTGFFNSRCTYFCAFVWFRRASIVLASHTATRGVAKHIACSAAATTPACLTTKKLSPHRRRARALVWYPASAILCYTGFKKRTKVSTDLVEHPQLDKAVGCCCVQVFCFLFVLVCRR